MNTFTILTHKVPNTTITEFANTVDPDEMGYNDHLDLECLPSSIRPFNIVQFINECFLEI